MLHVKQKLHDLMLRIKQKLINTDAIFLGLGVAQFIFSSFLRTLLSFEISVVFVKDQVIPSVKETRK